MDTQGIVLDCIISNHVLVLQKFELFHIVVVDVMGSLWDLHTFEGEEEKMFIFDNIIEDSFVSEDIHLLVSQMKANKDLVIIVVELVIFVFPEGLEVIEVLEEDCILGLLWAARKDSQNTLAEVTKLLGNFDLQLYDNFYTRA